MKGRNYVSPPCKDGGISCIYFSIPIKDKNEILGVAVLQSKADEFWELIEHEGERIGAGNVVILSNLDGVRIAHSSKKELIFQSWAPLKSEMKEQVLKEKRYGSDVKEIASTDFPEVMVAITQGVSTRYFQHRLAIGMTSYHSAIHAYPFKHNGTTTRLSVSIGIALFPRDAGNASELVKKADMALYDAKKAGRNRVCCYTAVHDD